MKQLTLTSLLLLVAVCTINAQGKKKQDKNAIKKMCGCYEVTFNFAETFQYSNDSLYKPSKTKIAKGLEWAQLVEEDKNKVSIQHLLQVGDPSKPHIVKHWRQDWIYENTDFYMFNGNNSWNYESKPESEVKGQWTQKVYQVDDSPRYEGSATWVHVDGKSFWENRTDAPLPRREYTKRSDYNVTVRGNRHEITKDGWIHDQNNDKVIREAGKADVILAKEKGYNTYVKVDDSRCKAAANWWKENNQKWALVRNKWEKVFSRNANLVLEAKVDNKPLYKHLFSDEYTKEQDINKVIESFVVQ
ncbi:hypothetical protein IWQ47_003466 [Aquimarina sp. EL_43]|uniref:DUF6607 family protein n=1 Tax=unclassified Aquimarina TaxID=2627091 RepID=UPI0018CA4914|nr:MULTISPECIES: DUF6607 family protein [unclassified Aquimarina]MBG6131792.1 hypothetical protein [Aquimarina sp. EL_35]MBG6149356.1 hypothetical protein [Aquimarina sp. EL_32]MBG6170381.1 hypothetical protein [Aquimarina sp. EL_43]